MVLTQPNGDKEREIVVAQSGLITRTQALNCGHTDGTIKGRLRRKEWDAVCRGVYRVTVYPVTPEQSVLAECLRSPGEVWASHESAAWLHGLMEKPLVHTVSTTSRLRGGSARVHHVSNLPPCDVTMVRGVPVTAIERTLIDVAARVPVGQLNRMMDEAITTRRTDLEKIEWRLRRVGGRGRAGLIVEVMGYRSHGGKDRWEKDLLRSSELAAVGWRVIYVTSQQIRKQRLATIERVGRALGIRPLFLL